MKVLIVGCNSLLSQQIISQLLSRKMNVTGVYNQRKNNLNIQIKYISINDLLTENKNYDLVYYIASKIPYHNMNEISSELINTNFNLLFDLCQKFNSSRIIYASSVSVYKQAELIDENSEILPSSVYAMSKYSGELIVRSACSDHVILRLPSLIGFKSDAPTFIPQIIKQAITEKKLKLYGKGLRYQNYLDIEDAANYFLSAIDVEPGTYLAVSNQNLQNKEIIEIVSQIFQNCPIEEIEYPDEVGTVYKNEFSRSSMNINSFLCIEDSIGKMV